MRLTSFFKLWITRLFPMKQVFLSLFRISESIVSLDLGGSTALDTTQGNSDLKNLVQKRRPRFQVRQQLKKNDPFAH